MLCFTRIFNEKDENGNGFVDYQSNLIKLVVRRRYHSLPPLTLEQWIVGIMFIILILGWTFQQSTNDVIVGWAELFPQPKYVTEVTLVCGIAQKAYYKGNSHIDALIIRKNPKGYGTKEVIEGNKPPKGSVVTVLEDVTTTGGSAMTAVNVLRDAGYVMNRVVTIVDRMDDHKIWEDNNIEFQSLF